MPQESTKQKYSLKNSQKILNSFRKKIPREVVFILFLFFISRFILTLVGVSSRYFLKDNIGSWYEWKYSSVAALDIWSVWDSGWYLDIAQNGYFSTLVSDLPKKVAPGQSNLVFFPLYPVSMRILGNILGDFHLAGIIVSNTAFILASLFLHKYIKAAFNEKVADRAVLFLYLFPTSYFFSAVLTEGLFLLTVVLAFYFAQGKKWGVSIFFAFLSALTKSIGFLLAIPLLIGYIQEKITTGKKINKNVFLFGLIFLAPALYMGFIYFLTGNPVTSFLIEKTGWGHGFVNPVSYLTEVISSGHLILIYFALLIIFEILVIAINFKKMSLVLGVYSVIFLLLPLFSGGETILAMPRFASVVFPLYISLALLIRSKISSILFSVIFISLQIVSMFFWNVGLFGY